MDCEECGQKTTNEKKTNKIQKLEKSIREKITENTNYIIKIETLINNKKNLEKDNENLKLEI
jgi:hypothetical protein